MWVTLEQTTGQSRHVHASFSSILSLTSPRHGLDSEGPIGPVDSPPASTTLRRTPSTIRSSNRNKVNSPGAFETLPLSSASEENLASSSHSPRARFAENPIIGPTREAAPLSRRKSALKSTASSQTYLLASKTAAIHEATSLAVDWSGKPPSSLSTSFLNPPIAAGSPKRRRTVSMIATDETPWAHPNFYPDEDSELLNNQNAAIQTFNPSSVRPRPVSMSDFAKPDMLSTDTSEAEAYETNRIKTLSKSNPSIMAGYVMGKDELFREKARKNLGLLPVPGERDGAFGSKQYGGLDSGSGARPLSVASSTASTSSSMSLNVTSTSIPSTQSTFSPSTLGRSPSLGVHSGSSRPRQLPPSLAPFPPASGNPWLNYTTPAPTTEQLLSPLGRISSTSSRSRPKLEGRKRSGTVLPPKRPELVSPSHTAELLVVLPASQASPAPKIEDKAVVPPTRPPRSTRRTTAAQDTPSLPTTPNFPCPSHYLTQILGHPQAQASNRAPAEILKANLPPTGSESIYGFSRSALTTIGVSGPSIDPEPMRLPVFGAQKCPPSRHTRSNNQSLPPVTPRRGQDHEAAANILQQPTMKASRLPPTSTQRPKSGASSSRPGGTDDEEDSDEFQSADEGDENLWSVSERKARSGNPGRAGNVRAAPRPANPAAQSDVAALQSPFESAVDSFADNLIPATMVFRKQSAQPSMIGAFPRSESFLSPSYSISGNCEEDQSPVSVNLEAPSIGATASGKVVDQVASTPEPVRTTSYLDERVTRAFNTPSVVEAKGSREVETVNQHGIQKIDSLDRNDPEAVEELQEHLLTPGSADRTSHRRSSSFSNPMVARTSSIEGLAALRNGNSPVYDPSVKKKSSARSSPYRQISKILSFRSKDSLQEDQPSSSQPPSSRSSEVEGSVRTHTPIPSAPRQAPQTTILPGSLPTWKSSMGQKAHEQLSDLYGPLEMRRQEVIWELCETEHAFVDGLRQVIDIFASPLRTPEGAWISGVPPGVAKLLDWLEDIVNLHSWLSSEAENCRIYQTRALGLVVHIADVFLEFAPKLEVYQPYLVRFSEVTAAIEEMTADMESDFGEFVRMQSSLPECGRMSLTSFLLKPVQRLMKYPLFFKQLCDVTPSDHPDHQATVSLLHSTDTMIRVLQEVKQREDEYESLKALQTKIKGLKPGFQLAKRDRRLLAQGLLRRVQLPARDQEEFDQEESRSRGYGSRAQRAVGGPLSSPSLSQNSSGSLGTTSNRSSIHWEDNFAYALKRQAFPSSSPLSEKSTLHSSVHPLDSLRALRARSSQIIETVPDLRSRPKNPHAGRLLSRRAKESPIHVFVFSDLILLATRHSDGVRLIRSSKLNKKKKETGSYYCALEQIGVSRLLSVADVSGELDYAHLVKLNVVPLNGVDSMSGRKPSVSPVSILLTFPDCLPGSRHASSYEVIQKERHKWIAAFHQSLRPPEPALSPELEMLAKLRDPSDPRLAEGSVEAQEREERTWWAARHQLVSRELVDIVDELSDTSDVGTSSYACTNFDGLGEQQDEDLICLSQDQVDSDYVLGHLQSSGLGLDFNI